MLAGLQTLEFSFIVSMVAHKLWSLVLDGLSRDVHSTSGVEVSTGTVGESITEYLTPDGSVHIIIS